MWNTIQNTNICVMGVLGKEEVGVEKNIRRNNARNHAKFLKEIVTCAPRKLYELQVRKLQRNIQAYVS